jgi:membrane protein
MGGELEPPRPDAPRRAIGFLGLLLKAMPRVFRQASSEWVGDNAPRLGAAVAFYTLLSLAPVIMIAVAVAAVFYGQEAAQGRLALEIQNMAGPDITRTIQELITRGAYQPGTGAIATLIGLAALAFGASSVFIELHDAMNTVWDVPLPQDRINAATLLRLIRDRSYAFATVLGIGFLLLVSLGLNTWIAAMRIAVPRTVTLPISYLLVVALFAALYKVVPDGRVKWSDVALGAMITSMLFMLGNQLMGLYFAHTGFGAMYKTVGSPVVVLLWVYYSAQMIFWGAEFSKVYTRTLGSQSDRQHGGNPSPEQIA